MKTIKSYKEFEAIGFQIKGDNRDEETDFSLSKKLGYKPHEVQEKIISLMRKLKEMADHGGGDENEKEAAMQKLIYLSRKYGVNPDNLYKKNMGLGYKFSWEDDNYDIDDINKEINMIKNEKLKTPLKFTFKTIKPVGRYSAFDIDEIQIKLNKKEVGEISPEKPFEIRLAVEKTETVTDNNPNCEWKWISLKKKSETLEEAKIFLNEHIESIMNKYTLHQFE